MVDFFKALYSHYRLRDFGALFLASMAGAVPFVGALGGFILLYQALGTGAAVAVFFLGFLVTGLTWAVSGRLLDRKFRKEKASKGSFLRALGAGWAEGTFLAFILVALFAIIFNSVPFYWAQGGVISGLALGILGVGTVLFLGAVPFFLPVRRRENLGLLKSMGRAFRIMNTNPALAAALGGLGLLSLVATVGSFGLFPGFGGLAALHQGAYDLAAGKDA